MKPGEFPGFPVMKTINLEEENQKLKNVIEYLKSQLDTDIQARMIKRLQEECDKKQLAILAIPAHFNREMMRLRQENAKLKEKINQLERTDSSEHEPLKSKPKIAVKTIEIEKKRASKGVMCSIDNKWLFFPVEIDSYWVEYAQRLFDCRNKKELTTAKHQIIEEIGEDLEVLWQDHLTPEMKSRIKAIASK